MIFSFLLIFIALSLQTIITVPIVLAVLLMLYIFYQESWVFLAAFVSGIFLDVITLRTLGESSIFLVVFLFVVALYERKFEVRTLPFVFFASFFGSVLFLWMFGHRFMVESVVSAVISVFLFGIFQTFSQKKKTSFL